jgi:hypothetical protein
VDRAAGIRLTRPFTRARILLQWRHIFLPANIHKVCTASPRLFHFTVVVLAPLGVALSTRSLRSGKLDIYEIRLACRDEARSCQSHVAVVLPGQLTAVAGAQAIAVTLDLVGCVMLEIMQWGVLLTGISNRVGRQGPEPPSHWDRLQVLVQYGQRTEVCIKTHAGGLTNHNSIQPLGQGGSMANILVQQPIMTGLCD